jgi:serine/threonine protein kinase
MCKPSQITLELFVLIQDYRLGDILGKGGFATVYRAVSLHNNSMNMQVAIKMVIATLN